MTQAYPLHWPTQKPRTVRCKKSKFKTTFHKARDTLLNEIKLLDGKHIIISSNIPVRRDGIPYADHRKPEDPGIAVYFDLNGKSMCFACDLFDRVEDNTQAISLSIQALRGLERWGGIEMQQAAFSGFAALPAPNSAWPTVLGVNDNCSLQEAENAYRQLAKRAHPDNGGSIEQMQRLNDAIAEARLRKG